MNELQTVEARRRLERKARIERAVSLGLTCREIAAAEGVSHQRIFQIIGKSIWNFREPLGPRTPIGADGRESRRIRRFWVQVQPDESGCWLWTGGRHVSGYGATRERGRNGGYAHRVAFEYVKGPIPNGLTIDHLCRVRACVNPAHLEAVSQHENIMRSPIAPAAINARKTHCNRGHPYDEANTIVWIGKSGHPQRRCRTCRRAAA